ncbi:MAG: DUF2470 domain-containing protein [Pseudomonadota bacterium]
MSDHAIYHPSGDLGRAKRLLREARQGFLTTLQSGMPMTRLVPVASDLDGAPLCRAQPGPMTLVLIDGNAALILAGDAVAPDEAGPAGHRFKARHGPGSEPCRIAFRSAVLSPGATLDPEMLLTAGGNGLAAMERGAVDHMNDDHLDAIKEYAETLLRLGPGDWVMTSLDMEGIDLRAGDSFARLWFDPPLQKPEDIRKRLVALAMAARA